MKTQNQTPKKELRRFRQFIQTTVSNENIQEGILDSYQSKQGKTDAEIYYPRFVFAKNGALFCHLLSLLVALPYLFAQIYKSLQGDANSIHDLFQAVLNNYNQIFQPAFLVAVLVAMLLLLILEYWKEEAANTFFNIFFLKRKKVAFGVLLWVSMLSAMSIFSSLCGGKEIVAVVNAPNELALSKLTKAVEDAKELQLLHADRSNAIIKQRAEELKTAQDQKAEYLKETTGETQQSHNKMLLIVLLSESLFFICKFTQHKYQFDASQESEEAFQESLIQKKKTKKKKRKTKKVKAVEVPVLPTVIYQTPHPYLSNGIPKQEPTIAPQVKEEPVLDQVPVIEKSVETSPKIDSITSPEIEVKTPIETEVKTDSITSSETEVKTDSITATQNSIEVEPVKATKTSSTTVVPNLLKDLDKLPVTPVTAQEEVEKVWTKSNCNSLAGQYEKRIQQNEMGATFERVAQQVFFEYHHKHFDVLYPSGEMPQVSPAERYRWFADHYPEQAETLPRTTRTLF